MSAIRTDQRSGDRAARELRARIDRFASQLRLRRGGGWDVASLERMAHEAEQLHGAAARVDGPWASVLAQLRGPLSAARQAQRLPDAADTASLIAIVEQLLLRLSRGADPVAAPLPRAELPPPSYWRRWAEDAPPPEPASDSPADAVPMNATAPAPDTTPDPRTAEVPYRVLIVEDDRAQALFAEGVLRGAGIEATVVSEPGEVMDTMDRVRPELVLMDLHMPGMSGTELTALIREQPAFLHTPIVFLTGDPDPERQFEVLECGADDFLQKPIRPRHLVAAVESRVKRARALGQHRLGHASRNPATGLLTRPHLMQRLGGALPNMERGGVFFIEVEGAASLRERHGYAALERVMTEAGRQLAGLAGACPAARLNDNAFLAFCPELLPDQLEGQARALRDGMGGEPIELDGDRVRLRVAVGHVALSCGFTDAGAVLEAAEQAARAARNSPVGLAAYAPPVHRDGLRELAADLRNALAEDRFELLFQPIVAVAGGEEAQYQTLLRLHAADGTVHNAGEIVPAAESAGMIADIDRWVLERALDVMRQRRMEGRTLRLFVPQSPRTLAREAYADWLVAAMRERGLEGPSLVLDVRLGDALIHAVTLRQFCEQMVPAGVQLCLSQYEHGDDADRLLAQLPLGYVRLSARYAEANAGSEVRDEMRTTIDRAHRLGLQVVGHRVEDPQAAATLWMSGIDYIQGNLVQQAAGELDFDFQHAVL